jgi:hypothetical protein
MVRFQKGAVSKVPPRMRNGRRRGWRIALNIATAVLLVTVTACSSHGKDGPKPHDWTATASSTDLLPTAAVSCPAAGYCITLNALVAKEVTYKHGSWKVQTVPGSGQLTAISCVTKSFCLAVGGNEYLKFDGSTWSAAQLVSVAAPTSLTSVSCVSPSFCMAVDIHSNSFAYDGTAWTSNPVAADGDRLAGVSCVSRQFCVTVGGDLIYTYNGTDWAVANTDLIGRSELDAVSCSSPTSCLAVGQAHNDVDTGYEASFNGTTWTGGTAAGIGELVSVSCPNNNLCAASSREGRVQIIGGASREIQTLDKGYEFFLGCSADGFCLAVEATEGKAQTAQFASTTSSGASNSAAAGAAHEAEQKRQSQVVR